MSSLREQSRRSRSGWCAARGPSPRSRAPTCRVRAPPRRPPRRPPGGHRRRERADAHLRRARRRRRAGRRRARRPRVRPRRRARAASAEHPRVPDGPPRRPAGRRRGVAGQPALHERRARRQLRRTRARIVITVGPLAAVAREAAAQAGVDDVIVLGEPSFGELMAAAGAPPESRPDPAMSRSCCPRAARPGCRRRSSSPTPRSWPTSSRWPCRSRSRRASACSASRRSSTAWACAACSTTRWRAAARSSRWRASTSRSCCGRWRPTGCSRHSWRRRCWPRSPTTRASRPSTCPRCARSAAAGHPPALRSSRPSPSGSTASSDRATASPRPPRWSPSARSPTRR